MKSILLILPAMPDYLPYVETYLQIFRKNQIDYKIVCWNRTDKFELDYLGGYKDNVTISDAYKAYDIMKGRHISDDKYVKSEE